MSLKRLIDKSRALKINGAHKTNIRGHNVIITRGIPIVTITVTNRFEIRLDTMKGTFTIEIVDQSLFEKNITTKSMLKLAEEVVDRFSCINDYAE